jgi:glycosyltransferase involved in cell wall biosynthesis
MTSLPARRHNILVLDNELGMGGSEKLLYDFANRFDRDRFNLAVCCLKDGGYWKDRIVELGIPYYENILGHKFDVLAFRKLARILRDGDIDLIDTYVHPNTVIFAYFAKALGLVKRFVVGFHASGNPRGGRLVPAWLKPFLSEADALVALAETHRRYLVGVEGLHEDQMEIICNGVDVDVFSPAGAGEKERLRDEFGLPGSATVFVTVASLKPIKRIDLLISAMDDVMHSRPDVRLVVVGDGPDRGALEDLARQRGLADRVVFTGIRQDVNDLLRMSDGLVLSSRQEAFPTAILEAMACGLPVVATGVGSVGDMVEPGENAIVVPPENRKALGEGIALIADNRPLARAYGEHGRFIVTSRFSVQTMCDNRQRLFDRLLAEN